MILAEVPLPNDKVTVTTPFVSVPEKVDLKNCTVSSVVKLNYISLLLHIVKYLNVILKW